MENVRQDAPPRFDSGTYGTAAMENAHLERPAPSDVWGNGGAAMEDANKDRLVRLSPFRKLGSSTFATTEFWLS